jgi:nicotinate phosphoribosyltransferase
MLTELYKHNLGLLTDLYQLTMAYGYWKTGRKDDEAVFNLFFRKHPFQGGYTITAGLETVIEFLEAYRFEEDDLAYLATLTGNDGEPLFEAAFLDYLKDLRFTCDVDAIPEGSVVFPHEPLLRIRGNLVQAQLLETPLLTIMNFQTLIATKAARICRAAGDDPVLEFGLRRAQGIDGGITASRAAYVGGCAATSNVLAGKLFGIPVKGTHAHSWVMCHDSEVEAFEKYAEAMPNNCVFLVDTYDSLEGVRRAVEVGKELRSRGNEMVGIRLDSGDLAWLSIEARKILDAGGFPDAAIVASNDLNEELINSLKQQGAKINVWGVGTKLATAYQQPALGGVYKLSAVRRAGGDWEPRIKLSEQAVKTSIPGLQNVLRYTVGDEYRCDVIFDELAPPDRKTLRLVDPADPTRSRRPPESASCTELLEPIFRGGELVADKQDAAAARARAAADLQRFYPGCLRTMEPYQYPVGLEAGLHDLKYALIRQARENTPS